MKLPFFVYSGVAYLPGWFVERIMSMFEQEIDAAVAAHEDVVDALMRENQRLKRDLAHHRLYSGDADVSV
jgi:hypothetical protein